MSAGTEHFTAHLRGPVTITEGPALAAIPLGTIVEDKSGGIGAAGAASGANGIAGEAPERGKAHKVGVSYASGEQMRAYFLPPGSYGTALLAASQTITDGDLLSTNASGALVARAGLAGWRAAESMTTGAGETKMIKVQKIQDDAHT